MSATDGPVIRLTEAPTLNLRNPECSACAVEVGRNADGWVCPRCGTGWMFDATDGETGTLYVEWSGEDVDHLPERTLETAWMPSLTHESARIRGLIAGQPGSGEQVQR